MVTFIPYSYMKTSERFRNTQDGKKVQKFNKNTHNRHLQIVPWLKGCCHGYGRHSGSWWWISTKMLCWSDKILQSMTKYDRVRQSMTKIQYRYKSYIVINRAPPETLNVLALPNSFDTCVVTVLLLGVFTSLRRLPSDKISEKILQTPTNNTFSKVALLECGLCKASPVGATELG